jgi:hypothetical protein
MTRLLETNPLTCLLVTAALAFASLSPGQAAAQSAASDTKSILVEGQTASRLHNQAWANADITLTASRF